MQRGGHQPVKCKGIAVHVRTLLEIDVPGQRLDIHHVGIGWLGEVQDHERADRPGVCACTVLLTSELVTNAVRATAGRQQAAIRLRLSSDQERVLVEVWDADPQPPEPDDGPPGLDEEGGRGLFLVAALSARWDWYLTREPAGKVVWCELAPGQPQEG